MPFFTFSQNNSGGGFDYDENAGISHFVIVEAGSAKDAIEKAGGIGLYFGGVDDGKDCGCCGDRWSDWIDDEDGTVEPAIYESPAENYLQQPFSHKWMGGYEAFIHYADGVVEGILK